MLLVTLEEGGRNRRRRVGANGNPPCHDGPTPATSHLLRTGHHTFAEIGWAGSIGHLADRNDCI
eukprot:4331594-Lingulodinium_polyedra.AAC.1